MKRSRLYFCDHLEYPLPPGHKFPQVKYRMLRERLSEDQTFDFLPAPLIDAETLALVHDPGYIESFLSGTIDPAAIRRIGFPWSPELVARTLASVGGTVHAAREALLYGWGGTLAGGTHHAFRSEGAGFCIFNDIAVAIESLRQNRQVARVAVVDLDVHQGDGTASIFENDPHVLTISLHGSKNFPFRKQRSRIDVEFDDGVGDSQYLQELDGILPEVLAFRPDIVFYQSGVDGLQDDALGRLGLSQEGLIERDRRVFVTCREGALPCVVTLGGGYAKPIEKTVEAHAGTFRTAARVLSLRQ